jgi:hypothetical protein
MMTTSRTRRDFPHSAALAAAGAAFGTRTQAAEADAAKTVRQKPQPLKFSADMRDGLSPRRVQRHVGFLVAHPALSRRLVRQFR